MHENHLLARSGVAAPRRLADIGDAAVLKVIGRVAGVGLVGRLRVGLPSGASITLGEGGGVEAALRLADFSVFWRALRGGSIGFAEAYIDGSLASEDIGAVLRFYLDNKPALARAGAGLFKVRLPHTLRHRLRRNTRAGSRRNIAAHYDLGNAFYASWLDAGLTYSSGIYRAQADTLEAAQDEKYRRIVDAMALKAGTRVLEIGCGWGGLAERMAQAGAHVTAITVSQEQLRYARLRFAAAGVSSRAEVRFQDYRDTTGTFDRIASVEMIEAVGEANWPAYFATLRDRLTPGGCAVVQAITIDPELFARYRSKADFIQRYVFPGGMLSTVPLMSAHASRVGLDFEVMEMFGASYARTLADWSRRFDAAWPQIARLGFDERFRRMWHYYLAYCEAGFDRGAIDVGIFRLRKTHAGGTLAQPA